MAEILLLTHHHVGPDMLKTAEDIIGSKIDNIVCIEVPMDSEPEHIFDQARAHFDEADETLLITDLYGSTPSNIASRLSHIHKARLVSGLNMAMLLRVINYQRKPLDELVDIAIEGGQSGIKAY